MSNKLNFANVSEAYNIASEQIKSRQDQIDKLKKIINENHDINKSNKKKSDLNVLGSQDSSYIPDGSYSQGGQDSSYIPGSSYSQGGQDSSYSQGDPGTISRLPVQPVQPVQKNNNSEDFEYSFYKLASNPKFDQAVQNYIILKQPEWLKNMNTPQMNQMSQMGKSNFGNFDSTDIKHYILFFVFSVIIYLILGLLIKN